MVLCAPHEISRVMQPRWMHGKRVKGGLDDESLDEVKRRVPARLCLAFNLTVQSSFHSQSRLFTPHRSMMERISRSREPYDYTAKPFDRAEVQQNCRLASFYKNRRIAQTLYPHTSTR